MSDYVITIQMGDLKGRATKQDETHCRVFFITRVVSNGPLSTGNKAEQHGTATEANATFHNDFT